MDTPRSLAIEVAGLAIFMLFVVVGLAMAHDPPSPADAAVGKGLLALAGATAIMTLCLLLDRRDRENAAKRASRPAPPTTYRDQEGA